MTMTAAATPATIATIVPVLVPPLSPELGAAVTFGVGVPRHPFMQLDDDLVPFICALAQITRRPHINVADVPRIIRNHEYESRATLHRADHSTGLYLARPPPIGRHH